jgi:hypothetical protein
MAGGGEHGRHGDAQRQDAASLQDVVVDAADAVATLPRHGAVVLVDYGCAQGRSSAPLLRGAIERIRFHRPDVPIAVVHEDVLDNDWAGPPEGCATRGAIPRRAAVRSCR